MLLPFITIGLNEATCPRICAQLVLVMLILSVPAGASVVCDHRLCAMQQHHASKTLYDLSSEVLSACC